MILNKRNNLVNLMALTLASLFMVIQLFLFPASLVFAEEAPPTPETSSSTTETQPTQVPDSSPLQSTGDTEQTTPASNQVIGPSEPQGPSAPTYTYNDQTGLWENDLYTWDPSTKQTAPKTPQDYSYNSKTGMWDTTQWAYVPETETYQPNVITLAHPLSATSSPGGQLNISGAGPNSNNTIDVNPQIVGTFDLFYNAAISNKLTSSAVSGDALVQGNTSAGSALTGDATAIANVLNMLQSSWLSQSPNIATFLANIDGSVYGDLNVDPNALLYSFGLQPNVNLDINSSTNAVIDNNIDLKAQTGDAIVSNNTKGGDATSGDAYALVNLINMINSSISADRSFIGMINILGDLNGDILIPENALNSTIASTGPESNNQIGGASDEYLDANLTNTNTINNNVSSSTNTGNSTVASNTTAGNASSGSSANEVNTINLIGRHINADRALLVFINVLGKWVGLMFGNPIALANVSSTGPNSNNQINAYGATNASANLSQNNLINNEISVAATSGTAEVSSNTSAGNAKSGDAKTSVNTLNMIDSQLNLSDWFGVLFINILGNWFGSFGSDTPAGNQSTAFVTTNSTQGHESTTGTSVGTTNLHGKASYSSYTPPTTAGNSQLQSEDISDDASQPPGGIVSGVGDGSSPTPRAGLTVQSKNYLLPILLALTATLLYLGERIGGGTQSREQPAR